MVNNSHTHSLNGALSQMQNLCIDESMQIFGPESLGQLHDQ